MPELAQLVTDNKVSVIANAGTLVEPVTRSEILAETANLPLFLFAHNHQQRELQTGQANNTDHGWGAHQIVMSGDPTFQGGKLLGTLPDLTLGGSNDFSSKGRLIPTTAVDQINASLINWLGVDTTLMPTIFPNLSKFQTSGTIDTAYLNLFA